MTREALLREALGLPRSSESRSHVMEQGKKMRLEAKGWKVGSAAKFLELTPEEAAEIDRRLETGRQQGADDPRSSGGERGRAAREG